MKQVILVVALMAGVLTTAMASAAQINVPADSLTIQGAINVALDGDYIIVAAGTYFENLNFLGKSIHLSGAVRTIKGGGTVNLVTVNGSDAGPVVKFTGNESASTVLHNLNLTNGSGVPGSGYATGGGGIFCSGSSPTIASCNISLCNATFGGAVACYQSSPTITGCTFSNNTATSGGGISCTYSSQPAVADCVFTSNSAGSGGAVYCWTSSNPAISRCTLYDNHATNAQSGEGGAVYAYSSAPILTNCVLRSNSATVRGGALMCYAAGVGVVNCTIYSNAAPQGGAVYCRNGSSPVIRNTIVSSCSGYALYNSASAPLSTPVLSYSCFYSNTPGNWYNWTGNVIGVMGNIAANPFFHAASIGDLHEESTGGRYDVATNTWQADARTSLCINAGGPDSYSLEPTPNGNRINMGAYGNTVTASKTAASRAPLKLRAYANSTSITITLSATATVGAEITNISGRTVANLPEQNLQAGTGTLLWNGRSHAGTKVPAGRYLVRVTAYGADGAVCKSLTTLSLK